MSKKNGTGPGDHKLEVMNNLGIAATNAVNAIQTTLGNNAELVVVVKMGGLYTTTVKMGDKKELVEILQAAVI